MGVYTMTKEKIIENLRDAGCDETMIANYFKAIDAGDREAALVCLEKHREKLLEQFHKSCSCIDCLDYFLMQSEKYGRGNQFA